MNLANLLLKHPDGVGFKEIAQLDGYRHLHANEPSLRRRFQRDKIDLKELGIRVEQFRAQADDGRSSVFRLARESTLTTPLALEATEHLLLDEVAESYGKHSKGELADLLHSAVIKLKCGAGSEGLAATPSRTTVRRSLALNPSDHERLEKCLHARAMRKPLSFAYRGPGDTTERARTVEPWGIVRRGAYCYLVGRDVASGNRRTFRLSRIKGVLTIRDRDHAYDLPPSARIDESFAPAMLSGGANATNKVGIRFGPDVAFIVANDFMGMYPMVESRDGSLTMTIPRVAAGELFRYLSEFAGHFRIFTPAEMKRDFKARLEEVLAVYA